MNDLIAVVINTFPYKKIESMKTLVPLDLTTYQSRKELEEKIRKMTWNEAKKIGIPKTTLHDLKKKILNHKEFRINNKNLSRLNEGFS